MGESKVSASFNSVSNLSFFFSFFFILFIYFYHYAMIGNVILAFSSFSAGAVIGAYTSQHIKFNHERKNGFGNIYTLTVLSDTSTGSLPKTSNPNPNSAPKRGPK